jgi:hypothetical protein
MVDGGWWLMVDGWWRIVDGVFCTPATSEKNDLSGLAGLDWTCLASTVDCRQFLEPTLRLRTLRACTTGNCAYVTS